MRAQSDLRVCAFLACVSHGWPLKTMGDALMLRNRLIGQLEKAEVETDPEALWVGLHDGATAY